MLRRYVVGRGRAGEIPEQQSLDPDPTSFTPCPAWDIRCRLFGNWKMTFENHPRLSELGTRIGFASVSFGGCAGPLGPRTKLGIVQVGELTL